jgi:hypothetical protein
LTDGTPCLKNDLILFERSVNPLLYNAVVVSSTTAKSFSDMQSEALTPWMKTFLTLFEGLLNEVEHNFSKLISKEPEMGQPLKKILEDFLQIFM